MVTQKRLKELLSYNKNTGVFLWKKKRRGVRVGAECGRLSVYGYREICVDGYLYKAHKLAFVYMLDIYPDMIDHINSDKSDNSFKNLRICDASQNAVNTKRQKNNTSGFKGVVWDKSRSKWRAQTTYKNKKYNLGRYNTKEEAKQAYDAFMTEKHGDFFRNV